jgi:hypothetical protein
MPDVGSEHFHRFVEGSLLFRVQFKFYDAFDSACSEDGWDVHVNVLHPIFAFEMLGHAQHHPLVLDDALNHARDSVGRREDCCALQRDDFRSYLPGAFNRLLHFVG